jgi:hypothetical protein
MFWIFLLLALLLVLGCYVTYKEGKYHELHKMRASFTDIHKRVERLKKNQEVKDPDHIEMLLGELKGIEEILDLIEVEEANCDLVQEIREDLKSIREKMGGLFGNPV